MCVWSRLWQHSRGLGLGGRVLLVGQGSEVTVQLPRGTLPLLLSRNVAPGQVLVGGQPSSNGVLFLRAEELDCAYQEKPQLLAGLTKAACNRRARCLGSRVKPGFWLPPSRVSASHPSRCIQSSTAQRRM